MRAIPLTIGFAAIPDTDHQHDQFTRLHFENDAVISDADAAKSGCTQSRQDRRWVVGPIAGTMASRGMRQLSRSKPIRGRRVVDFSRKEIQS